MDIEVSRTLLWSSQTQMIFSDNDIVVFFWFRKDLYEIQLDINIKWSVYNTNTKKSFKQLEPLLSKENCIIVG